MLTYPISPPTARLNYYHPQIKIIAGLRGKGKTDLRTILITKELLANLGIEAQKNIF